MATKKNVALTGGDMFNFGHIGRWRFTEKTVDEGCWDVRLQLH